MFKGLFHKRPAPRTTSVPEGAVVYAIGDIHGRADLLHVLLSEILEDMRTNGARSVLVGLGDYIDRGWGSRETIDLLLQLPQAGWFECCFLRGNHDQALLDFLERPEFGPTWGDFGGRETLKSYGVDAPAGRDAAAWAMARDAFAAVLPETHLAFFRALKPSFTMGDYFFAHAGARPGVSLEEQDERDLYWIREPFLSDPRAFDKVVVHGHSISVAVHADHRRIGVDTGAYATGRLTALRLQGEDRAFLFTDRQDGAIAVARESRAAA